MQWNLALNLVSLVFLLMVSAGSMFTSLLLLGKGSSYFLDWEIISLNSTSLVGAVIVDWMSMMFLSFVTFISSMVLYYSGGYMSGDKNINRFLYLVLFFVVSMGF